MNWNLFSKNKELVQKSSASQNTSAHIYMDNQGSIIDTVYFDKEYEFETNGTINSLLSKQSSIISESSLTIKEKLPAQDVETTNKDALKFLEWLNSPNSYPAPCNLNEIVNYLLDSNYKTGISGIVFSFKGEVSINSWQNTQLCQRVSLNTNFGENISYAVGINQYNNRIFTKNPDYPKLFVCETGDEILILFVIGNYKVKKRCYESLFKGIEDYIIIQNHLARFVSSFYKNSCFPSQIVQLTYKTDDAKISLNPKQEADFKKAVQEVKLQLQQTKGSSGSNKTIVPEHPSLEIEIKPLSIPTNATDVTVYDDWVSKKIYGHIDGGTKSSYLGENEYSNNAVVKLEDLYDGTFRMYNSLVIDKLSSFMINLFTVMRIKVNLSSTYLSVDTSKIKFYQKQAKDETRLNLKDSLITINEARNIYSKITEEYSNLKDIPAGNDIMVNLEKPKSNPLSDPSVA